MLPTDNCLGFILAPSLDILSPSFVIDVQKLRANAAIFDKLQKETGVKVLLALKAFAVWKLFPHLSRAFSGPLWGTCASSVDEARLGYEEFGGEVHAFAAAWNEAEMQELVQLADHISFNSLAQWRKFRQLIMRANAFERKDSPIRCGLRVNPEHSEGAAAIYNPCTPGSRLGVRTRELSMTTETDWQGLDGLHFHTLCEQNADALARTLVAFEKKFVGYLPGCRWLNWGGGHHITRPDYDLSLLKQLIVNWQQKYNVEIYLEPGEAVALDAGWLVATVLDVVEADMPVAILDTSAACHMPDVLEMPYRPNVWRKMQNGGQPGMAGQPGEYAYTCRLAGKSCLAGDIIGEYSFSDCLKAGDRLAFSDMAIYSMVKTTTFNGLRLPGISCYDPEAKCKFSILRTFDHDDFKQRLS